MLLKSQPSTIKFQAGLGQTKEPTRHVLKLGNHKTFQQWMTSQVELTKKPGAKRQTKTIIDDDITLED